MATEPAPFTQQKRPVFFFFEKKRTVKRNTLHVLRRMALDVVGAEQRAPDVGPLCP